MRSAECWVSLLALSTPDNLININHCHVVFPYAELNLLAPLLKSLPTREVFDAESKDASNLQSLEVLRVRTPSQKHERRSEAGVTSRTHIFTPSFNSFSSTFGRVQPAPSPSPSGQRRPFWAFVSSPRGFMPFFARAKCGDYLCVSVTLAVDSFGIMRIFFINTNRHSTKLP